MNIFVGNLPFATSEDDLRTLFGEYGGIESVAIVADQETGRSRGFGFVKMAAGGRAIAAIRELNGSDVSGRSIEVYQARPRLGE